MFIVRRPGLRYVNRGDPATMDFTSANFTKDETWRDLNLSAIVPVNAKMVRLRNYIVCATNPAVVLWRPKGNTNIVSVTGVRTQVTGQSGEQTFEIYLLTPQVVQYFASVETWTNLDVVIQGWWI